MDPRLFLTFLFLIIASASASGFAADWAADWTGEWAGSGSAISNSYERQCEHIEMRLLQEEDEFTIRGGGYQCAELSAEYPYSVFTIQGQELIYEGQKVGVLSEKGLHLSYENGQFNLWLTLQEDGSLFYKERWKQGEDFLLIEGKILKRK